MEGETPHGPPRRGRRRRLLAIVIGLSLVAAGAAIWWQFLRPRTIGEVLAFDHLQPGTQVVVEGTITGIFWDNVSDRQEHRQMTTALNASHRDGRDSLPR